MSLHLYRRIRKVVSVEVSIVIRGLHALGTGLKIVEEQDTSIACNNPFTREESRAASMPPGCTTITGSRLPGRQKPITRIAGFGPGERD